MPRPQEAISSRSATVQAWWVVDSCSREMDGFSQKTQRIHQKLMCFVEVCHLVFLLNKEIKIDFCGALFWAPFFGDTCLLSLGYWKKCTPVSEMTGNLGQIISITVFLPLSTPSTSLPSKEPEMGEEHPPREGEDFTQVLAELETPGRLETPAVTTWGVWMSLQKRPYK